MRCVKYSFPCFFIPATRKRTYVINESNNGIAILDVIGKLINGVTSKRLPTKININSDKRYGTYASPPLPITFIAISSLIKVTKVSTTDCIFEGTTDFFLSPANKNITTGEGGMIITNTKAIAEKIKILRLHGMSKDAWKRYLPNAVPLGKHYQHYDVKYTGYKYNMIDLQAAMGVCQLDKINKMWKKRKKLYENYFRKLKNLPIFFQRNPNYNFKHGFHLFVMVIDKKRTKKSFELLDRIENSNIYKIYPHKLFCNNQIKNRCAASYGQNIYYTDDSHLSYKGSEMVNDLILQKIKEIEK